MGGIDPQADPFEVVVTEQAEAPPIDPDFDSDHDGSWTPDGRRLADPQPTTNAEYVRSLLHQRQPEFAAVLDLAIASVELDLAAPSPEVTISGIENVGIEIITHASGYRGARSHLRRHGDHHGQWDHAQLPRDLRALR